MGHYHRQAVTNRRLHPDFSFNEDQVALGRRSKVSAPTIESGVGALSSESDIYSTHNSAYLRSSLPKVSKINLKYW
jgi:hypothetical protein